MTSAYVLEGKTRVLSAVREPEGHSRTSCLRGSRRGSDPCRGNTHAYRAQRLSSFNDCHEAGEQMCSTAAAGGFRGFYTSLATLVQRLQTVTLGSCFFFLLFFLNKRQRTTDSNFYHPNPINLGGLQKKHKLSAGTHTCEKHHSCLFTSWSP